MSASFHNKILRVDLTEGTVTVDEPGPIYFRQYMGGWNIIANTLLRGLGVSPEDGASDALTAEELRTVVMEAGAMIPKRHQEMMLNLIDLEKVTVEDIMVPRHDVFGIDMDADWEAIITQLSGSQYTRLPLFRENVEHVIGTALSPHPGLCQLCRADVLT